MSEKTEKPTSKRLRESRKKGQVAKSADFTSLIQLLTITGVFIFFGDTWLNDINGLMTETIEKACAGNLEIIKELTISWGIELVRVIGMVAISVVLMTIVSVIAQIGFIISGQPFTSGAKKFNIVGNLKQMFSPKNLFDLAKSLIKITLITVIFIGVLQGKFKSFQFSSVCGATCALPLFDRMLFSLFMALLIASLFIAMADYSFQRRTIMKQIMMTKEEVKQEYKDSEGNQEIKHKRKEIHRELQHSSSRENVKKSSVIIRNPTHISICLAYDKITCPVPRILEKATGHKAKALIRYGEMYGIPIVENIPLARGMYAHVEEGQFITKEFYEPVAEILRLVMNLPYVSDDNT